jgi:hypothetical protein
MPTEQEFADLVARVESLETWKTAANNRAQRQRDKLNELVAKVKVISRGLGAMMRNGLLPKRALVFFKQTEDEIEATQDDA